MPSLGVGRAAFWKALGAVAALAGGTGAIQPAPLRAVTLQCAGERGEVNYYRIDRVADRIDNLNRGRRWEKMCDGADNDRVVTGGVTLVKACRVDRNVVAFVNRSFDARGTVIERSLSIDWKSLAFTTTMRIRNVDPRYDINRGKCRRVPPIGP